MALTRRLFVRILSQSHKIAFAGLHNVLENSLARRKGRDFTTSVDTARQSPTVAGASIPTGNSGPAPEIIKTIHCWKVEPLGR